MENYDKISSFMQGLARYAAAEIAPDNLEYRVHETPGFADGLTESQLQEDGCLLVLKDGLPVVSVSYEDGKVRLEADVQPPIKGGAEDELETRR